MADIEIVIKIPDKLYEYIVKGKDLSEEQNDEMALAIAEGIPLPKHHGRLIDADRFADRIKEVSVNNEYDKLQLRLLTVADVLEAITHDLKGTSLNGFELCPTVIEADKEDSE